MSLPLLSFLKKRDPDCVITCICGQLVAPLFRQTGLVEQIIEVDEKRLLMGSFLDKSWCLISLWKQIFGQHYDLVLTAHPDSRYRWLTFPVRAKVRRSWKRKGTYHALEYVKLASDPEEPGPICFPELKVTLRPLFTIDRPYIVIAPGGAKNTLAEQSLKRYPIEFYAQIISALSKKMTIVVTGLTSDEWVREALPTGSYLDLIGQADLLDLIALLKGSSLLITHDSGPLHLAKLAKCQVLALFGPTNPATFVAPEESIEVMWGGADLPCRPCYNGKLFAACQNPLCMKSISPEAVVTKALEMCKTKKLPSLE